MTDLEDRDEPKRPERPLAQRLLVLPSIGGGVGQGEANDPRDVKATRMALARTGDLPSGRIDGTADLDFQAGLMRFQGRAGEKPDGRMLPGGPTERALARTAASADTVIGP